MQKEKASADELNALILQGIEDVKGNNIILLDLREMENTVCAYFIFFIVTPNTQRSEERRVGNECLPLFSSGWCPYH